MSASELAALAEKAARGAGAPPAQAADFGRAAPHHLAAGRDPRLLAAALDVLPGGPILAIPLILLRFIESSEGETVSVDVPRDARTPLLQSYADAQPFCARGAVGEDHLHLTLCLTIPAQHRFPARLDLPDGLAAQFQRHAARLLVPESETSRLKGAGAGLSDND